MTVTREGIAGRTQPHSFEAEQAVLGALLSNPNALDKVSDLQAEDFHHPVHRTIFLAAMALYSRQQLVDLITLSEELRIRGDLELVGGATYLTELQQLVPLTVYVEQYARIVSDHSRRRQLIQAGFQVVDLGYDEAAEAAEVVDRAQQLVFEVGSRAIRPDFESLSGLLRETMQQIESARTEGRKVMGVETGFLDLDRMTSGLQPGNLVIVAGRPSMGKTSFALNIAEKAALDGVPVAIFSLEMSKMELVQRLLCSVARVDSKLLRTGLPDDALDRIVTRALGPLERAPLFIDDQAALTVMSVRSRARRLKAQYPDLGMIVIDYLQLMSGEGGRREENRVQEITNISRGLKALARELHVPVVALSQLNRAAENRTGDEKGRPQLSDLRESGAIEQDADVVMFVYRAEYYQPADPDLKNKAEIILAKHRNGPTGSVHLRFTNQYTRFENADRRHEEHN